MQVSPDASEDEYGSVGQHGGGVPRARMLEGRGQRCGGRSFGIGNKGFGGWARYAGSAQRE
jgi:hypothetical protein